MTSWYPSVGQTQWKCEQQVKTKTSSKFYPSASFSNGHSGFSLFSGTMRSRGWCKGIWYKHLIWEENPQVSFRISNDHSNQLSLKISFSQRTIRQRARSKKNGFSGNYSQLIASYLRRTQVMRYLTILGQLAARPNYSCAGTGDFDNCARLLEAVQCQG